MEMTTDLDHLLLTSKKYVFEYINNNLGSQYIYHNIVHTEDVVEAAIEIGKGSKLSKEEMMLLQIAAWFHDIGFTEGKEGHEMRGAEIAGKFLSELGMNPSHIPIIKKAILATKIPQSPETQMEKVLCDADLYSLGSDSFFEKSNLLRSENEIAEKDIKTDFEWLKIQIDFLENHNYHTPYAKERFEERKEKNLRKLHKKFEI